MFSRYRLRSHRAIIQSCTSPPSMDGEHMNKAVFFAGLLLGCSAEHNFGKSESTGTVAGGDGRIEIFPADGVVCETMAIGHTSTCGFRVNSVGEYDLRLTSMSIIQAGENAGVKVFDNLRPADDTLGYPISIDAGASEEFTFLAAMSEEGTTSGVIEILTNDSTVNDPSPGKVRITLSATAVDYSGGGDDTGAGGDDTGTGGDDTDADGDDTGGGAEGTTEDTGSEEEDPSSPTDGPDGEG